MASPTFEMVRTGYRKDQVDQWAAQASAELERLRASLLDTQNELGRARQEASEVLRDRDSIARVLLSAQNTANQIVADAKAAASVEAERTKVALQTEIAELTDKRDRLAAFVQSLDQVLLQRQQALISALDRIKRAVEDGELQQSIAEHPLQSWDEQLGLEATELGPLANILAQQPPAQASPASAGSAPSSSGRSH
jgi:cell division septum initiation protein DivIVA